VVTQAEFDADMKTMETAFQAGSSS
jgi:hypothetical protein